MPNQTLFIVAADPRSSPVAAEAIRIAAGVGTWKKTEVLLYLSGPAILSLAEYVDDLVDEDNFTRYLPIFRDFKNPIYVEAGSAFLADLGESSHRFKAISLAELATLAVAATSVLRF